MHYLCVTTDEDPRLGRNVWLSDKCHLSNHWVSADSEQASHTEIFSDSQQTKFNAHTTYIVQPLKCMMKEMAVSEISVTIASWLESKGKS